MFTRVLTVFLVVLILCIAGCRKDSVDGEANEPQPQPPTIQEENFGDKLVIGSVSEPLNLIPLLATDNSSKTIASLIYNGLVKVDNEMNAIGDLAESWEISQDGHSIIFHLRHNIYWHDGMQLTADDILFTHAFIVNAGIQVPYASEFNKVLAISAMDKYTIMVEYEKVTMPALLSWSVPILPKHLLDTVALTKSPLQKAPIGTGPYIFDSWAFGESIKLKANTTHFAGTAGIAELEFRYFKDQDSAYQGLVAGDIDVLSVTPSEFSAYSGASFNKYSAPSPAYSYISYNFLRRPFNEALVREALSLAVDRNAIIQTALNGYGRLTDGPYMPNTYWYNDQLDHTAYDPVLAAAKLDEAGWALNKDGIRMKGKQALRVILHVNANPLRMQIAKQISDSWQALGVQMELKTQVWGEFLGELTRGTFDAALMEMSIASDPDLIDIWHSSRCIPPNSTELRPANALNFGCFKNEEADGLLESGESLIDMAERKIYYDRFQEVLEQERPALFLYVGDSLLLVSSRVQGVDSPNMHDIAKWYVPKEEHKYK